MKEGKNPSPEETQEKNKSFKVLYHKGRELLENLKKEISGTGKVETEKNEVNPMDEFWAALDKKELEAAQEWLDKAKQLPPEKREKLGEHLDWLERRLYQEYRARAQKTGNKEDWSKAKLIAENSFKPESKVGRIQKLQEELRDTEWEYKDI